MIKYQLICDLAHEFEGWFRDSADYDAQAEEELLSCPVCGSDAVKKAVMAPSIARRKRKSGREKSLAAVKKDIAGAVRRARDYVEKNFDYVGERFPEEARRIYYGESETRGVYGEASRNEVKELVEEGVPVAPMPAAEMKPADLTDADKKKLN
ncbi:MAG: DUF1178 family protein [Parvularculaceae bacterium]